MLILAATLLALLLVPVLGGRLGRLGDLRLHARWLVLYALGLQVLAISIVPHWPRPAVVALHGSSYALAGVFVWVNRAVPGLPVLALGAGLNALAIAVNGGQMPASASALAAVGLQDHGGDGYVNSGVVEQPRLALLGDVFPSPDWLPLRNVYSVGDLLILAGAVWLVHRTCRTVLGRDPRRSWRRLRARLERRRRVRPVPPSRVVIMSDEQQPGQGRRYALDLDMLPRQSPPPDAGQRQPADRARQPRQRHRGAHPSG